MNETNQSSSGANQGGTIMPLTMADPGQVYHIVRIKGKDDIRRHLSTMGIVESEAISVKQSSGGNVIAEVKGVRMALNASLANRIWVRV